MVKKIQAVILAAGASTRTYPLTVTKPKPLLKIANKTIIEHSLEQLQGLVDEVIIITGFKGDLIQEKIGKSFQGMKITYVEQKKQMGTGHAVLQAEKLINGRFLYMNGDDFYAHNDIRRCLLHEYAVLAKEVDAPERFGIFVVKNGVVVSIEEKPKKPKSNLANTGLWVMGPQLIEIMKKQPKTKRGEYEITDALSQLIKTQKVVCEKVKEYWLPIGYPWNILEANEFFVGKQTRSIIRGKVERDVVLNGAIIVEEGSVLKSGTYIEGNVTIGKNCKIGPNCYIRGNTSIGDGCHIGAAVEIKNCVVGDGTKIPHLSYIGDSVIGDRCNIAAGCIVANLRHDKSTISTPINGKMVDSGRRKFGTVIGDDVKLGIKTLIYPGRKIWPNKTTEPGEIVKKDLM